MLAQDFAYGDVSRDELEMKSYPKDISAHAVVLQEFGNAKIAVVTGEDIRMVFEYHVKIKILDNIFGHVYTVGCNPYQPVFNMFPGSHPCCNKA